jgi:hypothetical protein
LDKIIERSVRESAPVAAAPVQQGFHPAPPPPQQQYVNNYGHHDKHHNDHNGYQNKKSIWKELFD